MKFVRFKSENNEKLGIFNKDESKIIEISSVLKGREFSSMIDLIENITEDEMEQLQETFGGKISEYVQYDVSKVKICSPIKRPIHDIICVGVNYKSHLEETKESFKDDFTETEKTVYFSKRASEIIGTGAECVEDASSDHVYRGVCRFPSRGDQRLYLHEDHDPDRSAGEVCERD